MNTAKMKAAALAATPGEWCPDDHHGVIADAGLNANFYIASCSGPEHRANKQFIAAANPAAVLELIAAQPQTAAARDVLAERQRQISAEGWTPQHDDEHDNNELAFAAACYAFHAAAASWDLEDTDVPYDSHPAPKNWPWDTEWRKPKSARADLVRAAALIVAEIERIDRAAGINLETGGE
ncbi:ead/Ea22-like family protein [Cronobacter sakazakii]|nr:ead/Ea22-like family protein [Cronobacter sakazakii]MDI9352401.1 ead/Ea22-like family protein [Cronobacter sakazakii]